MKTHVFHRHSQLIVKAHERQKGTQCLQCIKAKKND